MNTEDEHRLDDNIKVNVKLTEEGTGEFITEELLTSRTGSLFSVRDFKSFS